MDRIKRCRAGRAERSDRYLDAVRKFFRPMLKEDGSWNIELTSQSGRLDLQLCSALFGGGEDEVALANHLTQRAPIPVFNGKRFDIFQTSQACHLMVEYGDRMESDTLALCEAVVDEGCSEGIGMTAPVQTSARCSGHVT